MHRTFFSRLYSRMYDMLLHNTLQTDQYWCVNNTINVVIISEVTDYIQLLNIG